MQVQGFLAVTWEYMRAPDAQGQNGGYYK